MQVRGAEGKREGGREGGREREEGCIFQAVLVQDASLLTFLALPLITFSSLLQVCRK